MWCSCFEWVIEQPNSTNLTYFSHFGCENQATTQKAITLLLHSSSFLLNEISLKDFAPLFSSILLQRRAQHSTDGLVKDILQAILS